MDWSGAQWFKSSRSSGSRECVEIAHLNGGAVGLRDSKNPAGPALIFTPTEWDQFTASLRGGAFDRP